MRTSAQESTGSGVSLRAPQGVCMRRYRLVLAAALVLGTALWPVLPPGVRADQVSPGQRLAYFTKPSVVRILDGYVGSFYFNYNQKTYNVQYIGSGSGSFIDPN